MAVTVFPQFTAYSSITNYAVMIFNASGTIWDPYYASISIGVALILDPLTTTYLADHFGRKLLCLISLIGAAIGLFSIALYHYVNINGHNLAAVNWIPVLCLFFVIFITTAGILPLSHVYAIEYLTPKVRY